MKTTTFAILAVAATAILSSPSAPAEAKTRAQKADEYYQWCLGVADRARIGNAVGICLELTDKKFPQKASELVKTQRLKLKQSRPAKPRLRVRTRTRKTSRY